MLRNALAFTVLILFPLFAYSKDRVAIRAAVAVCGPPNAHFSSEQREPGGDVTPPPVGMGQVYVTDNGNHHFRIGVAVDGSPIGSMERWGHLRVVLNPGIHHFCARVLQLALRHPAREDFLMSLNVEAGQTYYLLAWAKSSIPGGEDSIPVVAMRAANAPDQGRLGSGQAPAQDTTAPRQSPVACGPAAVQFSVRHAEAGSATTALEGKARVYLIGDSPDWGVFGPVVRVGVDGNWIGAIKRDSHLAIILKPGIHHFCVQGQGWVIIPSPKDIDFDTMDLLEGHTYYLLADVTGVFSTRSLSLQDVNEDEGKLLLAESWLGKATTVK